MEARTWKLCRFDQQQIGSHPDLWQGARDGLLAEAFQHTDVTPEYVQTGLVLGQMQLWLIYQEAFRPHGAVVTQSNDTVTGRECLILLLGGRGMANWLHLLADIENWARTEGCNKIVVMGRKGWGRVLKDYDHIGVILGKDL